MKRIKVIVVALLMGAALCVVARLFLSSQIQAQEQRISDMRRRIEKAERMMPGIEAVRAKIANDQLLVSQRMSATTSATLGRGKDKVAEVDAILADSELNRLALVYLGSDWSIKRSEFLGNVKHMRELIKMQQDEFSRYNSDIEKKIKELELEKKRITHLIGMTGPTGRPGVTIRLGDVEAQLSALRQIAGWGNMVSDDLRAKKLIEAKATTEKAIFELAMSCQANTVGALNNTMAAQIAGLKREEAEVLKQIASLQDSVNLLNNFRKVQSWLDFWPLSAIWPVPQGSAENVQ